MPSSGYVSGDQVVFFEGVDKVYQREFKGKKISSVAIPETVVAIQSEAFANCKSLTAITIPDSVKKISTRCFEGCSALKKAVLPNGLKVFDECVFYGCESLEEVVIPDSVTQIAPKAFSGCSSLSKVTLPRKLKSIGEKAFAGSKIETIAFPAALETIGKDAFLECPFTQLHVPGNVKYLSGFRGTHLEEVTLEEGLETVGEECFCGCASLTALTVPESVRKIERGAFMDCSSLQTIRLPKTMDVLEDEAFGGCVRLERIDVPEGVKEISRKVFAECTAAHVRFPSTVEKYNTFPRRSPGFYWDYSRPQRDYNDVASLTVSSANKVFAMESGCLVDKQKRELLYVLPDATAFPKNLKSIDLPGGFFPPLYDVEELVIPEGVTSISSLPFHKMGNLKKLVLPVSLQKVSSGFFDGYPFPSVSVSPEFLLSNHFYRLPERVDLIGVDSINDDLRRKVVEKFRGNDRIFIYAAGQLLYPTAAGLKAREEARLRQKKKEMAEKVEDAALLSLCKSTFDPGGFAFEYLESGNQLTVTVFDSLKIVYVLQMDTAEADLSALLDVATSYRDALAPYITASSDPHLVTKADWDDYGGNDYISSEPFPDVLVRLRLEAGAVGEAFRALENLEMAYDDMLRKYGNFAEKLVRQDKNVR